MKMNVVAVGSLKEKFHIDGCNEYHKRISRYHNLNVIEVAEEKLPKNHSIADISKNIVKESLKIEKHLQGFVIVLDKLGSQLSSEQFADKIDKIAINYDCITFVIGSSYGLAEQIKDRANALISFSQMTFPHQLFRQMLLEQIYRACTISNNIIYHK